MYKTPELHFRALLAEGGDALVEGEYFLGDPSLDPDRRVPLQACTLLCGLQGALGEARSVPEASPTSDTLRCAGESDRPLGATDKLSSDSPPQGDQEADVRLGRLQPSDRTVVQATCQWRVLCMA
jgi:hypothetical protein